MNCQGMDGSIRIPTWKDGDFSSSSRRAQSLSRQAENPWVISVLHHCAGFANVLNHGVPPEVS